MSYSIEEHKHRFAAWAAGRAANVNGCRFTVEQAKKVLEDAGLNIVAHSVMNLPDPKDFDCTHEEWRERVIEASKSIGLNFTHGVAAKLINIYLKSIFVCSNEHNSAKVKAIHPPIDSVLLDALYKQDISGKRKDWQAARKARWSKLSSKQYQAVINAIKEALPSKSGLWEIEEFWQGYQ
ncbi:MAG: hypothetical protein V2I33_12360 [Kangiellaceae bacterium]|jgi:hypothetical protein|nr:hypothetical protein [Kangiellaceae bacterium]